MTRRTFISTFCERKLWAVGAEQPWTLARPGPGERERERDNEVAGGRGGRAGKLEKASARAVTSLFTGSSTSIASQMSTALEDGF